MTDAGKNRVQLLAVTEGKTPTKLSASGLRVPITDDTWVALDFKQPAETAWEISIAWRSTRRPHTSLAKLAVVPRAGNIINVEITFGNIEQRRALDIFPVNAPDERNRHLQMLAETSSGDPVGEMLFRDGGGTSVAAREFRIECSVAGWLQVKLVPIGDVGLEIQIMTVWGSIPTPKAPTAMLSMFVKPHAANAVSVCVRESKGMILR